MKSKIICLLTFLCCCGLAATPNRNCDGLRCTGKPKQVSVAPAKEVSLMIEDVDLLPFYNCLSNY